MCHASNKSKDINQGFQDTVYSTWVLHTTSNSTTSIENIKKVQVFNKYNLDRHSQQYDTT